MLRFLGKTTASMAKINGSSHNEVCDEALSTWELVNESRSDDESLYSYDSDELVSDGDEVTGDEDPVQHEEEDDDEDVNRIPNLLTPVDIIAIQSMSVSPPMTFPVEMTCDYSYREYGEECDVDDEDVDLDDDDDDDEVDDEMVPWKLKDRFGKERIRKMGKRGGPKLNKSKSLAYRYNRPGCLYGKHGFGVQHAFI